ncbi:MAG: hypothetical protein ACFFDC_00020 [Promethearchaeota archaeon]
MAYLIESEWVRNRANQLEREIVAPNPRSNLETVADIYLSLHNLNVEVNENYIVTDLEAQRMVEIRELIQNNSFDEARSETTKLFSSLTELVPGNRNHFRLKY